MFIWYSNSWPVNYATGIERSSYSGVKPESITNDVGYYNGNFMVSRSLRMHNACSFDIAIIGWHHATEIGRFSYFEVKTESAIDGADLPRCNSNFMVFRDLLISTCNAYSSDITIIG